MAQLAESRITFCKLKISIPIDHSHCHAYHDQNNHKWFGALDISCRDIYGSFKYVFHWPVP